jgi:hypothetical protein
VVCPLISFLPADLLRTNFIALRFWTVLANECFIFSVLADTNAQFRLLTNLFNGIISVVKEIKGNDEQSILNWTSAELEPHQHIKCNADVVKAADVSV